MASEERIGGFQRGDDDDDDNDCGICDAAPKRLRFSLAPFFVPATLGSFANFSTPLSLCAPSQLSACSRGDSREKQVSESERKVKEEEERGVDGGGGRSKSLSSRPLSTTIYLSGSLALSFQRTSGLTQRHLSPTLAILGATPDMVLLLGRMKKKNETRKEAAQQIFRRSARPASLRTSFSI